MKLKRPGSGVSLFFAFLFSFGILGAIAVALFAIQQDFRGSFGLKVKDWIELDYQGRQNSFFP